MFKTPLIFIFIFLFLKADSFSSELALEIDPYYTNLGYYFDIGEKEENLGRKSEFEIYSYLLKNIYRPKTLVFESSFNPLPYLGTVIKRSYPQMYKDAYVGDNFNWIKAVTAGFEEPWAFSVFFGNVVGFDSIRKEFLGKRKGYSGILFDFGDYHIRDNSLIYDKWVSVEIKLKGEQIIEERTLSWSYRFGFKFHSRNYIKDEFFIGIKRQRTDYKPAGFWYENCGVELTSSFSQDNLKPIRHLFIVDKKIPLKNKRASFSIGAGFIWDSYKKYSDDYGYKNRDSFQFLLRPNIEF